ncbi:hypothetical protein TSUD_166610 [Trifolium subterraneum]|uniref:Reverse transcriptase zinc-binding domain-containing protein n=1 Tax=Trifolium subterraneum TaxID=3900 RepID=A0A2Z6M4A4_TRISU|nr:hypothetical protein TSUD_166610 [Trifolium subterraneum]
MTSFWFDPWLGGTPLRTQFQRLFQVSTQSTSTVREMGKWVEGQWLWDLRWRRDLFVWELNLLEIVPQLRGDLLRRGTEVASKSVENLGPFKSGGLFLAASAGQVKTLTPLVPFMSGVSILLYAGTDRVCWGVMLGLDGSGGLETLFCFVLPVVDLVFLFMRGFLALVVPLRGSSIGGGVSCL